MKHQVDSITNSLSKAAIYHVCMNQVAIGIARLVFAFFCSLSPALFVSHTDKWQYSLTIYLSGTFLRVSVVAEIFPRLLR